MTTLEARCRCCLMMEMSCSVKLAASPDCVRNYSRLVNAHLGGHYYLVSFIEANDPSSSISSFEEK